MVVAYHLLKHSRSYEELGGGYFGKRKREAVERRLVRRLERPGYKIPFDPVAA